MQKPSMTIRLHPETLDKLDMICSMEDISRSAFLKKPIRKSIEEYEKANGKITIDPQKLEQTRKPGRR